MTFHPDMEPLNLGEVNILFPGATNCLNSTVVERIASQTSEDYFGVCDDALYFGHVIDEGPKVEAYKWNIASQEWDFLGMFWSDDGTFDRVPYPPTAL